MQLRKVGLSDPTLLNHWGPAMLLRFSQRSFCRDVIFSNRFAAKRICPTILLNFLQRWIIELKVAQNSFQHSPRRILLLPLFINMMLQSWYKKTAQSLVNSLLSFSWQNKLPKQHYDLLKSPLISSLSGSEQL